MLTQRFDSADALQDASPRLLMVEINCANCGDGVTMESPHINYCLDYIGCPECGNSREVTECGLWCSFCASDRRRRVLDESPVEEGDTVAYRGDAWTAEIGPETNVWLYPLDVDPSMHGPGDGTEYPVVADIKDVEPVTGETCPCGARLAARDNVKFTTRLGPAPGARPEAPIQQKIPDVECTACGESVGSAHGIEFVLELYDAYGEPTPE